MRQNQCRFPSLRDQIRHRKSFTRTGHAEQRLEFFAARQTIRQLRDRCWLITRRFEFSVQLKFVHLYILTDSGEFRQR